MKPLLAFCRAFMRTMFGCTCPNTTFPQTRDGRTYVCCTDCGREYPYDFTQMRRVA